MSNKEGEAMGGERVKVRIAVVVGEDGSYSSSGWTYGREVQPEYDEYHVNHARNTLGGSSNGLTYWLTAELPIPVLPVPQEVAAGVEVDG